MVRLKNLNTIRRRLISDFQAVLIIGITLWMVATYVNVLAGNY